MLFTGEWNNKVSDWPRIVQPITLETEVTMEVYQNEIGIPLIRLQVESLDCALWITIDCAELIGNVAKQVRTEFEHQHIN